MLIKTLKAVSRVVQKKRGVKKKIDGDIRHKQSLAELTHLKNSEEFNRKASQSGYSLDPDFSTDETKVFVNHNDKKAVVAYRGTHLKGKSALKDIGSDFALAFGMEKYNKRFQDSDKQFKKIKAKYPDFKLDVTGHSLGG